MPIDWNNPWVTGILGGAAATFFSGLVIWAAKKASASGWSVVRLLKRGRDEQSGLAAYRKSLEDRTLRISHPWMKEDQTLDDILVAVNLKVGEQNERVQLQTYLRRVLALDRSARMLIVGKPGSGKSVAMGLIARIMWTMAPEVELVPVLMTFSDIKGLHDHAAMEKKIVEILQFYQFQKGKKSSKTAEEFVKDNLYEGRLLLLFDGYDELDKPARKAAGDLLNSFLGTHSRIPAVISSRVALYEREPVFDALSPCRVDVAPFTPYATLKFLSQWKFGENKSSQDLFRMINGRAHLSELASNPLMLTIIAFLYSLPKYTLPDNRVEFYEQCTRALLEEWDRARQRGRANKFEAHQKTAVLSRLAFEHITSSGETDELIREDMVHDVTKAEMERLSLKSAEYTIMEREILYNSGLLQLIPPDDYRFPHRTFMEFFAANHIYTQKTYEDILRLYDQDAQKWKETLLLYMGVNKNKDHANALLSRLRDDFVSGWHDGDNPNLLVFDALTECAVPDPDLANEILDLADRFLAEAEPLGEIIELLGYIGANPRWAYAQKAKDVLLGLLNRNYPDAVFQQVLFALLHARDERVDALVLDNIRRVYLPSFLSRWGAREKPFVNRLLELEWTSKEKQEIVNGLKEAGNVDLLGALLVESRDDEIRTLSGYALLRMSRLDGFNASLDSMDVGLLDAGTEAVISDKVAYWGWTWDKPTTESGKTSAVLVCWYAAKYIEGNTDVVEEVDLEQMSGRFKYLTNGFLLEEGMDLRKFNLLGFVDVFATVKGLRHHWRHKPDIRGWRRHTLSEDGKLFLLVLATVLGSYWLLSLIAVLGSILFLSGNVDNAFYEFFFLFDDYTEIFLALQFVLFLYLNNGVAHPESSEIEFSLEAISGLFGLTAALSEHHKEGESRRFYPLVLLILACICAVSPLLNIGLKLRLLLLVHVLGTAMIWYDVSHLGFAFFLSFNLEQVSELLSDEA